MTTFQGGTRQFVCVGRREGKRDVLHQNTFPARPSPIYEPERAREPDTREVLLAMRPSQFQVMHLPLPLASHIRINFDIQIHRVCVVLPFNDPLDPILSSKLELDLPRNTQHPPYLSSSQTLHVPRVLLAPEPYARKDFDGPVGVRMLAVFTVCEREGE